MSFIKQNTLKKSRLEPNTLLLEATATSHTRQKLPRERAAPREKQKQVPPGPRSIPGADAPTSCLPAQVSRGGLSLLATVLGLLVLLKSWA